MITPIAYTIKQAATACGISRTTLYGLIKAGELTPVKIGARTLIRHADLESLMERKLAA
jgi:excisionase family DNA binding protein